MLKHALSEVEAEFAVDELAYLALTQKVEQAFRDKLAFRLHKRFEQARPQFLVCREWQRADLAIIEDGLPVMIIEAKAGYTFDIMNQGKGYNFSKLVAADLKKATELASRFTPTIPEIYALAIVTHPNSAPAVNYSHAVKYYRGVKKYAVDANNQLTVDAIMSARMNMFDLVHKNVVKGGEAFRTQVSIYTWLYRAKSLELHVEAERTSG